MEGIGHLGGDFELSATAASAERFSGSKGGF
jgi:hypothetical protein